MNVLNLERTFLVLKLTNHSTSNLPLQEQVSPFIDQSTMLLLDVKDIQFNSMLIGEVVNVYHEFTERWRDHYHRIGLINVSEFSTKVFESVGLTTRIPVYPNAEAAFEDFQPKSERLTQSG